MSVVVEKLDLVVIGNSSRRLADCACELSRAEEPLARLFVHVAAALAGMTQNNVTQAKRKGHNGSPAECFALPRPRDGVSTAHCLPGNEEREREGG